MKKLIALSIVLFAVAFNAHSAIKCVPTGGGGTCCWDTDRDGPWKPLGC